jgi:hypothetical protein
MFDPSVGRVLGVEGTDMDAPSEHDVAGGCFRAQRSSRT